jgi:internalin A
LDVTGLTALQYLNLSECSDLSTLTGIDTLTGLQHLDLSGCSSLCSVLDLTGLIHLQLLDLTHCWALTDVQGIDTLVSLHTLSLDCCGELNKALDLTQLTSLKDVSLNVCTAIPAVTGISKLTLLADLNLRYCYSLSITHDAVGIKMTALRTLEVSNGSILSYFQRQKLPALDKLTVSGIDSIFTLDCGGWPALTKLMIKDCKNLTALQGLDKLHSLEKLLVFDSSELEHIPELGCLKTLKSFLLKGCTKLSSIHNTLTDFEVLTYLGLQRTAIGKAIMESTNSCLVQQVSALKWRSGFIYGAYDYPMW